MNGADCTTAAAVKRPRAMKKFAPPLLAISPVVMVFLKAPRAGFVKTRLARSLGAQWATELYCRLVERQIQNLPAGWRIEIHFTPDGAAEEMVRWLGPEKIYRPQVAGDLGCRLAAGGAQAFAGGATAVIAIGGDCPELTASDLEAAARALATKDVVIGPADDGGYYLIGLRRPAPELFEDIPWGSPAVFAATLARIADAGLSCHQLATKIDIDDLAGLRRFIKREPADSEFAAWLNLIAPISS